MTRVRHPVRRTLGVVLAVGAVVCVVLGLRASSPDAAARHPGTHLGTAVWSTRRAPELVVDGVGAQRLQAALTTDLNSSTGCFLVEARGAGTVASANATQPFVPASTQKLLTAAAALHTLGPDAGFTTRALAPSAPRGGTVGRLYLVGGGDPLLATPDYLAHLQTVPTRRGLATSSLASLADSIVAAGVRTVPGGVAGDDSAYHTPAFLPVWPASYRTDGEIGAIGALTVNDGYTRFTGTPVPSDTPAVDAAAALSALLTARGVTIGAPPQRANAPAGAATVATVRSPPLRDLVTEMLSGSDNHTAEMLTLALGKGATGPGLQAILGAVAQLGVPVANVHLVDGSGLSHDDRLTCATLDATLALGDRADLRALRDGLAIAGRRGTLVTRFAGPPLSGRLIGKTGTLQGVAGLVADIDVGPSIRATTLFNGSFDEVEGDARTTSAAEHAGRFPDAPPAGTLVPAP